MKRLLLILMVLASVAMAGDAEMKALLVGNWIGEVGPGHGKLFIFQSDGTWLTDPDEESKWDVKDGKLIEPEKGRSWTILFLDKDTFLARGEPYLFLMRAED
jgi:hypothetical protein